MEIIAQLTINSIISGLLLMLVAYGFSLIFNVTKVFHIAHGGVYVVSVYIFIFINSLFLSHLTFFGIFHWIIPLLATAVLVSLLASIIEWGVYKPLYNKHSNELISLISSLGVYIIIVNTIAVLFGNDTKIINNTMGKSFIAGNIILTHSQQIQFLFSIICLAFLTLPVIYTNLGRKMRAVANNQEVASAIGINVKRIRLAAMVLGSLFAASGALLKAYDVGINPQMGMSITLSAVVVVILAGRNTFKSLLIASIGISVIQNVTEWFLSAQWEQGITYLILIIVLLSQTEGILSYKLRAEAK